VVTVETPFLDMDKMATTKELTGIDIICEGTWKIDVATDPTEPDNFEELAVVEGSTPNLSFLSGLGSSAFFRFRMTSQGDGYARIGKFAFHFEETGVQ